MLKSIKNYYLKRTVKSQVELYYLQLGINPKDLENMTMQEILEKINYTMKNLAGWREEYYKNLDLVATLNGEIISLNAKLEDLDRQLLALEGDNIKYKMKNQFLTEQNKTYRFANGKMALDRLKESDNVVSHERG